MPPGLVIFISSGSCLQLALELSLLLPTAGTLGFRLKTWHLLRIELVGLEAAVLTFDSTHLGKEASPGPRDQSLLSHSALHLNNET